MRKYIKNYEYFITKVNNTGYFSLSRRLAELLNKTGYIKIYISSDSCYIKLKVCNKDDINSNKLSIDKYGYGKFSCVELNGYSFTKCYGYGNDTHGGIIFRIKDCINGPCNFTVLKKDIKLFFRLHQKNRNSYILSNGAINRLNNPVYISLYHDRKNNRLYLKSSKESIGSYKIRFMQTSLNSGYYITTIKDLSNYLKIDTNTFKKYEIKQSVNGFYIDLNSNLSKNSRGSINGNRGELKFGDKLYSNKKKSKRYFLNCKRYIKIGDTVTNIKLINQLYDLMKYGKLSIKDIDKFYLNMNND